MAGAGAGGGGGSNLPRATQALGPPLAPPETTCQGMNARHGPPTRPQQLAVCFLCVTLNRNQSSGNVPPASALALGQTKSQPRWQSRTLPSAALWLQKALTFSPSAHNLGATLHGNGSNPQLCLQGSGRPGSNPSTAPFPQL